MNIVFKNGHLPLDYNPDRFQWTKANLTKTEVPARELEKLRDGAWNNCIHAEFKNMRKSWQVKSNFKIKENKTPVI